MMPVVRLSDGTFEKLQQLAVPLQDTVDSVVARLADFALAHQPSHQHTPSTDVTDSVDMAELWTSTKRCQSQAEIDRHEWRRQFWEEILDYIAAQRPQFQVQSPNDDSWSTISIGRSNITIMLTLTPKRKCIGCELYLNIPWKAAAMDTLLTDREAIETEIGHELTWDLKPGQKSASIFVEASIDPKETANRDIVKQWMYEMAVRFYCAFHDRVANLKPL